MSTVAWRISGNGEVVYTHSEQVAKQLCAENLDLEMEKILID